MAGQWDTMPLEEHLEELKTKGYTAFKHFLNKATAARLREQASLPAQQPGPVFANVLHENRKNDYWVFWMGS